MSNQSGKKEEDPEEETTTTNTETPEAHTDSFTAKIDGASYTATIIQATVIGGKLQMTGSKGTSEGITITIASDADAGSYTSSMADYSASYAISSGGTGTNYIAESGSPITITSHDKTNKIVKGTFSFIGKDFQSTASVNITDGEFAVQY